MRFRKAFCVTCIVAVAVLSICFAFTSPALTANRDLRVKVMTRNMDPGVDLAAIALATDPNALASAVAGIFQSNIPERARLVAAEIAQAKPDLVALQEATRWRIELESGTVVFDQLDLLLACLTKSGQHYRKAVVQTLTDVQLDALGYTDSDVILVRSDQPPDQLVVSRPETHLYQALMSFDVPFQTEPLTVLRGWESVNVTIRGFRFKFVNTHLESPFPDPPPYTEYTKAQQVAQGDQLMEDLKDVKLPVILAGDFNSDAEHTNNYPSDNTDSYNNIVGAGFNDAWEEVRPNSAGFTWSLYAVPFTTPGVDFLPFERIDLIFSNGPEAISIMRTGLEEVNGRFASDHAGVVAVYDLAKPRTSDHDRSGMGREYPTEYFGCKVPQDLLKNLHWSGFRKH